MKDAVAVRVLQRVGDRGAERLDLHERQRTLSQPGLERAARHELHDEEVVISLGVEVEHRRDPGMRQPGERQRLTPESLAAGVVAEGPERAAQQHLDCDRCDRACRRVPSTLRPCLRRRSVRAADSDSVCLCSWMVRPRSADQRFAIGPV